MKRLIRQASFRYRSSVEEINFNVERGWDRNQFQHLAELTFVCEHKDLSITGSTGTGKSYLAISLGYEACQKGMKVLYASTNCLMGQLKIAKAKGNILQELKKIERTDLLILDDFGMQPFNTQFMMNLMDVIEDRYGKNLQ